MGNLRDKKIIILTVLFSITCFLVYRTQETGTLEKKKSLQKFLAKVDGYKVDHNVPFDEKVRQTLDLDDYVFTEYSSEKGPINLFIGYYYTAAKMSAAHSPLVCLPAQGWTVDRPVTKHLSVGNHDIHYEEVESSLQDRKDLVLYWYQSSQVTAPQVFRNKINTFYNKLMQNKEEHAFVRVTVPFANITQGQAQVQATDFIQAFYPKFLEYIDSSNTFRTPHSK